MDCLQTVPYPADGFPVPPGSFCNSCNLFESFHIHPKRPSAHPARRNPAVPQMQRKTISITPLSHFKRPPPFLTDVFTNFQIVVSLLIYFMHHPSAAKQCSITNVYGFFKSSAPFCTEISFSLTARNTNCIKRTGSSLSVLSGSFFFQPARPALM